jgi:anthranilate synthase
MERPESQRDVVLFLPDRILVVDQDKRSAWRLEYDFTWKGASTAGLARQGAEEPYKPISPGTLRRDRDSAKGEYARRVEQAKHEFKVGNLFEVVLSQTFFQESPAQPSEVFTRLRETNPSPYGFLINLGRQEYLVGASPEMFVRCERTRVGLRVETCPISGTIARGSDALEDAARIKAILTNPKEESELTMCTDVDRNDKSRICEPGSVRVLGRRQIEMYSRLIHTVDHVEGYLRQGFDALDAFLCHTWAVTVTGAPKTWAIQFIEDQEASPRAWYGGAVGLVAFDGSLNTGLTLRTVRVLEGVAEVRAGATLLYDSDPPAEEAETELKASALVHALATAGATEEKGAEPAAASASSQHAAAAGAKKGPPQGQRRVLLVDHEDSFVHTLANYLRQTGAAVTTVRAGPQALRLIAEQQPDLVVLSPGPGCPDDFQLKDTIQTCVDRRVPMFGVCLGLQGMVEYFGGKLDVLAYPMHGKPSLVDLSPAGDSSSSGSSGSGGGDGGLGHRYKVFEGIPPRFEVARYHSLHGNQAAFPKELRVTAMSEDGVIMAIEHRELPIAAVQFHPESILTNPAHGLRILANAVHSLVY